MISVTLDIIVPGGSGVRDARARGIPVLCRVEHLRHVVITVENFLHLKFIDANLVDVIVRNVGNVVVSPVSSDVAFTIHIKTLHFIKIHNILFWTDEHGDANDDKQEGGGSHDEHDEKSDLFSPSLSNIFAPHATTMFNKQSRYPKGETHGDGFPDASSPCVAPMHYDTGF